MDRAGIFAGEVRLGNSRRYLPTQPPKGALPMPAWPRDRADASRRGELGEVRAALEYAVARREPVWHEVARLREQLARAQQQAATADPGFDREAVSHAMAECIVLPRALAPRETALAMADNEVASGQVRLVELWDRYQAARRRFEEAARAVVLDRGSWSGEENARRWGALYDQADAGRELRPLLGDDAMGPELLTALGLDDKGLADRYER